MKKSKAWQYISLISGLFISAVAFNMFFNPTKLAYGGTSGIAIITEIISNGMIKPSITIAVFYALTFILGFILLGKRAILRSLLGTIIYPIFITMTSFLSDARIFDFSDNLLVIYIFGAILAGLGSGLIYRTGFSGGGTDIIRLIAYKYAKLSMGTAGLIINSIIVITGAVLTGNYGNVLYALLILYIMGIVTDKLVLGISSNKMLYIITNKEQEVRDFIINVLGRGVTIFDVRGGISDKKERAIMCLVPSSEYFLLTEGILAIDSECFFITTDAYEVAGGM